MHEQHPAVIHKVYEIADEKSLFNVTNMQGWKHSNLERRSSGIDNEMLTKFHDT